MGPYRPNIDPLGPCRPIPWLRGTLWAYTLTLWDLERESRINSRTFLGQFVLVIKGVICVPAVLEIATLAFCKNTDLPSDPIMRAKHWVCNLVRSLLSNLNFESFLMLFRHFDKLCNLIRKHDLLRHVVIRTQQTESENLNPDGCSLRQLSQEGRNVRRAGVRMLS